MNIEIEIPKDHELTRHLARSGVPIDWIFVGGWRLAIVLEQGHAPALAALLQAHQLEQLRVRGAVCPLAEGMLRHLASLWSR